MSAGTLWVRGVAGGWKDMAGYQYVKL